MNFRAPGHPDGHSRLLELALEGQVTELVLYIPCVYGSAEWNVHRKELLQQLTHSPLGTAQVTRERD